MIGTQTLTVTFVLDDTPLLSRKCDCGSEEFRKIIFPESSFALLLDNGLVVCLACKKIFALV
jgi:hypothetical protein